MFKYLTDKITPTFLLAGKNSLFSNLKILLLEGSPNKPYEFTPKYSNRVVALNQNTKSLMNSLKIWRHVENKRLQPVRHMQVSFLPI